MPSTANERGLADPFEPIAAIREAASYLRELRTTFGNLGLAAAAYNAGPYGVSRWLDHKAPLPDETIAYVLDVTGRSVEDWSSPAAPKWTNEDHQPDAGCEEIARLQTAFLGSPAPLPSVSSKPWGVQVAGAWKEGQVLAAFERLRRRYPELIGDRQPIILHARPNFAPALMYMVRLGEDTASDANRLCSRLREAGGACDVLRNPR